MKFSLAAATFGLALLAAPSLASTEDGHAAPVSQYVKSKVMTWINDPVVINAVKAQDARNENLTQADINALDRKWRVEVESPEKPLIDGILENKLSKFLQEKQAASKGIITEIFVMDNKGLNVGESDVTSDYWQGDEAKFQKSYGAGPDGFFVDAAKKDESTQQFQAQASFTLKDKTGKPIGAVTVGISLDNL